MMRYLTYRAYFCHLYIALWNPDPEVDYSTIRTENEFGMMQKVTQMMDDAPVAVPYLCVDVKNMKLLVTQWACNADEQWANQVGFEGFLDYPKCQLIANLEYSSIS